MAGQLKGALPQRTRRLPFCPPVARHSPRGAPPLALGANEKLGAFLGRAVHRVEKPLLAISLPVCHTHAYGLRAGRLPLTS